MKEIFYHQVDKKTGEINHITIGKYPAGVSQYKQVREKGYDAIFLDAWYKAWPDDAPLLSDVKLFRQWRKLDRKMRAIDDRMKSKYN